MASVVRYERRVGEGDELVMVSTFPLACAFCTTPKLSNCGLWKAGSRIRLRLKAASAAVRGEPSWNVTPFRMLNVQTWAERCFQEVAIQGRSLSVLGLRWSRVSKMLRYTM